MVCVLVQYFSCEILVMLNVFCSCILGLLFALAAKTPGQVYIVMFLFAQKYQVHKKWPVTYELLSTEVFVFKGLTM